MIRAVTGRVKIHSSVTGELKEDEVCASPGMKYKHYSSRANVVVFTGDKKEVAKRSILGIILIGCKVKKRW